ncbi:MAG: hypothetical protein JXB15_12520 [Anaerolineales bacterium]|nr:hypothetical protein [Anaerolineales bacterium]
MHLISKILRLGVLFLMVILVACNSQAAPSPTLVDQAGTGQPAVAPKGQATEPASPGVVTSPEALQSTSLPAPTPMFVGSPYPIPGIELESLGSLDKLDLVVQMGAYWLRRNGLSWSEVEPEEGQRNWEALAGLEQELKNASERNLQLILVIRRTPAWAQKVPGSFCGPVAAEKLPAFASFVHDVVARYSQPPYNVKYWEFGNEPDVDPGLVGPDSIFGCWGDQKDAYYGGGYYAEMLKSVYPQVKAADPQSKVLVGGLLLDCDPVNPPEGRDCAPSRFMEGVLRSGGGDYLDGISFHAYDYYLGPTMYGNSNWSSVWNVNGPVLVVKARFLRNLLVAYGQPDKFLINTEVGILCGRDGNEPDCLADEFQLTKAAYMAEAHAAAMAEGLWGNIWYSLTGWRGTGLIREGKALPALEAFRISAGQLTGATFSRAITEIPGVTGYEYTRDGKRSWIIWSLDGAEHQVQAPDLPAAIYDVFGQAIPVSQQITAGAMPVYVEWGP